MMFKILSHFISLPPYLRSDPFFQIMMFKILSHFISLPPFLPMGAIHLNQSVFARIDQILQKNVAGTFLKGCPKFSEWHS
jgi:hypothetical protein